MLKSPKTVAGQIIKKTIALVMAYCFLATSSWSLNFSGSTLPRRTSPGLVGLPSLRNPLTALGLASARNYAPVGGVSQRRPAPKIFTNVAELHAAMTAMQGNPPAVLAGDQTIESNIDSNDVGVAEAFPATATASGQIASINVFLDAASASTRIYVGIYADSGGHPSTLLTQGNSTQLYPGTWNTFNVTPVNLTSGTAYWMTILGTTGGEPMFRDRNVTGCHSLTSSQSTLTSLPSSWTTGQSWGTCFFSAYAVAGTSPATVLIGDQAVEASLDKNPAGRAEAFPAVANATGTVDAINLYLDPTSGAGPVFTGLYADNSGHPGALLGQGSTTQPVAGNWNQISITPSNIVTGHKYWIAVLGTQATSPFFRDRLTSACSSETTPQSNLTSLPSTWTTGTTWSTCYISAYGLPGAATASVLSISTGNISFAATQGGANPAPASLSVSNTGTGTLSFSASTDTPWLSVSPASGTAPQTLQVSASVGTLASGTYTGHVTVTAAGAQNSPAVATVTLTIASDVPPSITASASPAPNANGWNNSNVTVTFTCTPGSFPIASCSPATVVSTEGANQSICGTAVDTGGFSATACTTVSLDRTAPIVTGSVAPSPNAAGWNNTNVIISYLCSDSLSGIAVCPAPVTIATEGAAQNIGAVATDKAGNSSSVSTVLNIDKTPPVVTVTSAPPPNGAGWNNSNVTVNFSCTDSLSGVASCPTQQLVASEGQNQNISGIATDIAGNTATGSISLSIDKTPPTIVQLSTPDHVSALHSGLVSVTVNDNFTVAQVVISVNGTALSTFTSPPYQANLQVPAGSVPGDTLTVTAVATDAAGNTQTASHGVSVTADGVVVGQVLSDATGLPVQGASVQLISSTGLSDQTDAKGRYSFPASDAHLFLSAANTGNTTVEREIFVQPGAGTVAIDARLTPLSAPSSIGSAGGTLASGPISITVPAASVPDGTSFQLTPLSGQGLPGLLPLGWSPLAAFDLRASALVSSLPAVVSKLPGIVLHLATYNTALHAWTLVTANLQSVNGSCSFTVPGPGDYALVTPDVTTDPQIPIPDPGGPLTGIAVKTLDPAAASSGSLNPPMLPPAGGTAIATLGVQSPGFTPSGTIVQANISETFSLTTKEVVSEQTRTEDIILYNALAPANSIMGAQFPVTPSHQYSITQLVTGKVHLDILSGREGVRGQPGGNDPLTLTDGIATLSVPGGALNVDTAISVQGTALEDFVPTTGSMSAIQEVLVDFSGEILNTPAQLSISASGLNPGDTFLLTQVQRINGVPHMVTVAQAQINGTSLSSVSSPGLPGVTQGGEYIFYDISAPAGFVQGITSSSAGPVPALVLSDSLQIAGISGGDGHYIVPVLAGTANLTATSPNTSLAGTATIQVAAGQTVAANILLAGTVTSATVSPADGTLGVPTSTIITITTSAPLNPQSIAQSNLSLVTGPPAAPGAPVPLQPFILSTSGTTLSFSPVNNLAPATQYTIHVSGLADVSGGAVAVPTSSFTTKASAPLNFDPNAITFAFPDQNGNIHVSAPAGSLPPGSRVLIVDVSNSVVLGLAALNDGSLSGDFSGTINDVLQVTATDPNGATASFTLSQFVAPDGTTAIGPGGGTVNGPGGIQLQVPAGALSQGSTFKIEPLNNSDFTDHPQFAPNAVAAGGIRVNFNGITPFKQEIKLVFPKPAGAPDNAAYFVFRRLLTTGGDSVYEVIDEASQQGTGPDAKITTNSPPYRGFVNFTSAFNTLANTVDQTPGVLQAQADFAIEYATDLINSFKIQSGAILGVVRRANIPVGGGETTFDPVPNATVQSTNDSQVVDPQTKQVVTTTDDQGRFTLWDPNYNGGNRQLLVTAPDGSQSITVIANEVIPGDDISVIPDIMRSLFVPFLSRYRNVAYINATFPALPPPPSAPNLQIQLFQPTSTGLQQLNGLGPTNTDLTIRILSTTTDTPSLTVQALGTITSPQSLAIQPAGNDGQLSVFTATYNTPNQGTFRLQATVIPPLGGNTVNTTYDFRAVQGALSGANNVDAPNDPPSVASTFPQRGEQAVDIRIAPQVFFTEPVTNISNSTVGLSEMQNGVKGSAVNVQISGVTPTGLLLANVGPTDIVTSLVIQPIGLLQYSQSYALSFSTSIVDTDKDSNGNPAPKNLSDTPDVVFQTQGPEIESRPADVFPAAGVFVANNTAFLEKISGTSGLLFDRGNMTMYNVSNPVQPLSISLSPLSNLFLSLVGDPIEGRPVAVAGEDNNTVAVAQGKKALIAVAASSYANPHPSNIHLYADDGNQRGWINWLGSVSVSTSPLDGMVNSVVIRGDRIYAATWFKGIQVVDINQVISDTQHRLTPDPLNPADALLGFLDSPARQVSINRDLYTEGQGFATDSVINTVPVSAPEPCATGGGICNPEFKANIANIKVSDYVIDGQSATWVIGTGAVQPASDAPAGTNPSTFVAVNPATNEVFRSTLEGSGSVMVRGIAIDVGQIQNPALPNINNIAVAVGQGSGGSSLMFILNLADPRSPATLNTTILDANLGFPTDVLVRDKVAAVAFQHVTELYDISDPRDPQSIGTIGNDSDPVGGKIAFSSDGSLLFSTAFVAGSVGDKSGGLHITEFSAGAFVNFIPPVLSKEDDPSNTSSTRTNEVKFNITTIMVPTASKVDSAQLQLFIKGGGPIPCPGTNPPAATCPVSLHGTLGTVTFPAESLSKLPADLLAQVTYNVHNSNKPLTSAQVGFHLGVVKILVDLNNDTVVDDNDRQVQLTNAQAINADKNSGTDPMQDKNIKRFDFWQSDNSQLNVSAINTDDPGVPTVLTASIKEDALQDYATLKIHAEALPPDGYTLGIKLDGGAKWALTQKAPGPKSCIDSGCSQIDTTELLKSKEHLSDPNTVTKQLNLLTSTNELCQNSSDPTAAPGECLSDSSGFVSLSNLTLGDTVALFRCIQCGITHQNDTAVPATPPDGTRGMLAQVMPTNGTSVDLDRVDVDLRPIQSWVGAFSARDGSSGDSVPTPTLKPVSGWQNMLPNGAQVTVLVHGFAVSRDDALGRFIPKYVRRLYWSEHPVLAGQTVNVAAQGAPALNALGGAYVVGVAWNGDRIALLEKTSGLFFPDDEFNALETGVPLADFFSLLTDSQHNNFVNVISHSLGNMAVNSALTRLPAGVVSKYMMNEAALPAEAFSTAFPFTESDTAWSMSDPYVDPAFRGIRAKLLNGHLNQLGLNNNSPLSVPNASPTPDCDDPSVSCATDQVWVNQLNEVLNSKCDATFACLELFNDFYDNLFPGIPDRNNDYSSRWRNTRPGSVALDPTQDFSDTMGPWQGFFASNLDKTTIFNSFNRGDCALNEAWFVNQIVQEPDRPLFDQLLFTAPLIATIPELDYALLNVNSNPFPVSQRWDSVGTQSWLTDVPSYPLQDATHPDLLWTDNSHRGIHLQWARLAKWYPARSGPAGISDYSVFVHNNGDNIDLTSYGAPQDSQHNPVACSNVGVGVVSVIGLATAVGSGSDFHGYMLALPFSQVWPAYKKYLDKLYPGRNTD